MYEKANLYVSFIYCTLLYGECDSHLIYLYILLSKLVLMPLVILLKLLHYEMNIYCT